MRACTEQHEIRPHDGSEQLGGDPPEHKAPIRGFGSCGGLPAELLEEGAVDHDLLQPREKGSMKQKGPRSKRASSIMVGALRDARAGGYTGAAGKETDVFRFSACALRLRSSAFTKSVQKKMKAVDSICRLHKPRYYAHSAY